jgi:hypothetical protein
MAAVGRVRQGELIHQRVAGCFRNICEHRWQCESR